MRTRTTGLTLAFFCLAGAACFGASQMGSWTLNEAKSKIGPGNGKNRTVVYQPVLFKVKVTIDGTDANGKSIHNEWTGNFDGKDYPVKGDPNADVRSYTKIDARTLEFSNKKGGRVTASGRIVVSADGKSRTVTANILNAKGKKVKTIAVYDKAS